MTIPAIAEMDFRPVPTSKRKRPARIKNVGVRLYIDRFEEYRKAYQIIQREQELHGMGTKTLVKALLHYRDTVAEPLEAGENGELEKLAYGSFTPLPQVDDEQVKFISIRLYPDKWQEDREAFEFLQKQQDTFGEGQKTVVRALLLWEKDALEPMRAQRQLSLS